MIKTLQFIMTILAFSLFIAACEKDPVEPDPTDPINPTETEDCFTTIDLTNYTQDLRTVCFINENEGWLVGQNLDNMSNQSLLYTTDGGLTWTVMNVDLKQNHSHNVSAPYLKFHNSTSGYMIGDYEYISGGYGGYLPKHTTDKGQTWSTIPGAADGTWDVVAINSTDAIFIGHSVYGHDDCVLYKVSNSTHEITLTVELPSSLDFFAKVDMHLSEEGTINVPISSVNTSSSLYMARSTDNGANWTYTEIELESIHKVDFPTDNTGYVIGDIGLNGSLYKTTDGGATWAKKTLPMSFIHVDFFDANNGIAIQEGHIYKTTDGAETWTEVSCFSDSGHSPSRGVAYTSLDKWFAIGSRKEFYIYEKE